jgi:peptide deformylase
MAKYKLVDENDPILKQKCSEHIISEYTEELSVNMINTMIESGGIGLAAPQVGLAERLFVVGAESQGFVVCINPIMQIAEDAEEETYVEGCLSFPHLELKVKRKNAVLLQYTNVQGVRKTTKFVGVWAQAIQHEMDHLDGVLFQERVGKTTLSLANSKRREKAKRVARAAKRKS